MISGTDIESTTHNYRAWRSQVLRRSSGLSHSGSPGSKTRITKTSNTSYSPHSIQRRRTTASQAARLNHRIPQDHAFLAQDPFSHNHASATHSVHAARPVSWHPGFGNAGYPVRPASYHHQPCRSNHESMIRQGPGLQFAPRSLALGDEEGNVLTGNDFRSYAHWETPSREQVAVNPIADFETLAVSDSSRTSFRNWPPTRNEQSFLSAQEQATRESGYYSYMEPDSGMSVTRYPGHQGLDDSCYQNIQQPYPYDASTLAQTWAFPPNDHPTYATPTSPSFLPIQIPLEGMPRTQVESKPPIAVKKSTELVGMGLYDDKNGSMFASLDSVGESASGLRDSLGKGLKLEETWEPPNKDETEGDNADEGYSTDDAEEELPVAPAPQESQAQVYPAYGDLSNQTFFFDTDEQYGNYMVLDQGTHAYPSKPSDPVPGNFFWI